MKSFKQTISIIVALLFFASTYAVAQVYTAVDDAYVFQILEEANSGLDLSTASAKASVFRSNDNNFVYWENAKALLESNAPNPIHDISNEMVGKTTAYLIEVVETMNIKK